MNGDKSNIEVNLDLIIDGVRLKIENGKVLISKGPSNGENKPIKKKEIEWYTFYLNTGWAVLAVGATFWIGGGGRLTSTFAVTGCILAVLGCFLVLAPSLNQIVNCIRNKCERGK
jgi:hypothetical protein